jgi:hypothetical protein
LSAVSGLKDSGTLGPSIGSATVTIDYTSPSGSTTTHTATTDASGDYSDSFRPTEKGSWHVQAHFGGDSKYLGSDSSVCSATFGA